jgi:hypothetical protein
MDGLRTWKPDLADKIINNFHRKHGGNEMVGKALSRFGKHKKRWTDLSEHDRDTFMAGVQDVKDLFHAIPVRAGVRPPHWFRHGPTSSGLPYLCKGDEIDEKLNEDAYRLSYHIRKTNKKFIDYKVPPVIPFVKAVTAPKDKYSTRGIWAIPGVMKKLESMFATDLYNIILKYRDTCHLPVMIGKSGFQRAKGFIHSTRTGEGVYALDYVKGDTTIPAWKLRLAFDVLEGLLDFDRYGGRPVTDDQKEGNIRLWEYVKWYFINTPIVFNNVLYRKYGGIVSGSLFTLLIWLIVNNLDRAFVQRTVFNKPLRRGDGAAGGDDGLGRIFKVPWLKRSPLRLDTLVAAGDRVGAQFHGEGKSQLRMREYGSADIAKVVTLSTTFGPTRIMRDRDDTFARMLFPSGWVSCREESVARVLSISMSLCRTDPVIDEFAQWYLRWKPVNWDRPVKLDRDYVKYFKYVLGVSFGDLATGATLRDLASSYLDLVKWTILAGTL